MSPSFELRAASAADMPDLMRLIRELSIYEKLEHMVTGDADMLREALFGANPVAHAVVAQADGRAVGFALYFWTFSTFLCKPGLYLEDLFVEPPYRGRGVGKALLQRLAALVVERGGGRFEWRVLDWNEPSIRFYESLGATVMREWLLARLTGAQLERLGGGQTPTTTEKPPPAG